MNESLDKDESVGSRVPAFQGQTGSAVPSRPERAQLTDPDQWVDRHGDALFRFALTRLGDRHAAEDLVQETFIAALRSGGFTGQANERTWFIGILKHKLVDHLRRRGRERTDDRVPLGSQHFEKVFDSRGAWRVQPGAWPSSSASDAAGVLDKREFWEVFQRCLDGLPQRLRTIFSLREVDERPTKELCEVMELTPGHLAVLLYRARMGLRACLEEHWFNSDMGEA